MKKLSRRGFAGSLVFFTSFCGVSYLGKRIFPGRLPLDRGAQIQTLLVLAELFTRQPIELSHYEQFFDWRLRNVPSDRECYLECVTRIHREALTAHLEFLKAESSVQDALLSDVSRSLFGRRSFRRLKRDVLRLFARTDAWILLGYSAWPGTARGFSELQRVIL